MRTDNVVRKEAMGVLFTTLGSVDAERFICMVKRDSFDYTEWQRTYWDGKGIKEIHEAATSYERVNE